MDSDNDALRAETEALRGLVAAARDAHERQTLHMAELIERNTRLSAFGHTVAHDLLQPVASVSGFLALLDQEASELTTEHREWLQAAARGTQRITEAVHAHSYAAFAEDVSIEPLDLRELVSELIEDFSPYGAGAEVVMGDLPSVPAHRGCLSQVLMNVFQNAGRYRDAERACVIDVQARRDGQCWVLMLSDTGRGVRDDELDAIFESAYRGRSSVGTLGTGTGLATARTLMRRMGGDVWAERSPGGGLRINLRFQPAPT